MIWIDLHYQNDPSKAFILVNKAFIIPQTQHGSLDSDLIKELKNYEMISFWYITTQLLKAKVPYKRYPILLRTL